MDYETVVIVRPHTADTTNRYGDPVAQPDDAPTEIEVPRSLIAFASSAEPVAIGRAAVITDDTVYMPDGTDVRATDDLRIRGDMFQVIGDPQPWTGAGVVVAVKRVSG